MGRMEIWRDVKSKASLRRESGGLMGREHAGVDVARDSLGIVRHSGGV